MAFTHALKELIWKDQKLREISFLSELFSCIYGIVDAFENQAEMWDILVLTSCQIQWVELTLSSLKSVCNTLKDSCFPRPLNIYCTTVNVNNSMNKLKHILQLGISLSEVPFSGICASAIHKNQKECVALTMRWFLYPSTVEDVTWLSANMCHLEKYWSWKSGLLHSLVQVQAPT